MNVETLHNPDVLATPKQLKIFSKVAELALRHEKKRHNVFTLSDRLTSEMTQAIHSIDENTHVIVRGYKSWGHMILLREGDDPDTSFPKDQIWGLVYHDAENETQTLQAGAGKYNLDYPELEQKTTELLIGLTINAAGLEPRTDISVQDTV